MESPRPAAAGVEPQQVAAPFLAVFVGVAEHHHVRPGQVRRHVLFVVDHVKPHAFQRHGQVVGKACGPVLVVVAPHHIQRRERGERIHHRLGVDVPRVENGVGGFQKFQHRRPQQAVGVGENDEVHGRLLGWDGVWSGQQGRAVL